MSNDTPKQTVLAHTPGPWVAFRLGFARAKEAAVDRCRVEIRGNESDEAIHRCIVAIEALDVRHYQ